jgi:hypothetical protein
MKDKVELTAAIYPATLVGQRGGCGAISACPPGVIGPHDGNFWNFWNS